MLKQSDWLARNVKPIFQSTVPINELYDLSTKLNHFHSKTSCCHNNIRCNK
eukprot:UN05483